MCSVNNPLTSESAGYEPQSQVAFAIPGSAGTKRTSIRSSCSNPVGVARIRTSVWTPSCGPTGAIRMPPGVSRSFSLFGHLGHRRGDDDPIEYAKILGNVETVGGRARPH